MSSYTCGRCAEGPTGMTGHYGKVCRVTARIENRQGIDALLNNPFHFCCPSDCELFNEDGTPKPAEPEPELIEADADGDWYAGLSERVAALKATDSHCHVVRDGDAVPCPGPPGEPHVDEAGDAYRTVPLIDGGVHGG